MKRHTFRPAFRPAFVALLVGGLLSAGAVEAQSRADTTGALTTVRTFVRANEVADLDLMVSTFADEATLFLPVGDAPYRLSGKAQIRAAFAALFKGRSGPITITPTAVEVQFFGDLAVVTAHLRDVPPLPITAPITFARRTFVLQRVQGQWLIVHHHASNFAWTPPGS